MRVFAMPEVGIGFFPDVGGSYLLPDLGGSFGMYLGLTGNRIGYGDALWSGLATHTVQAAYLPALVEEIAESGDPGTELREFFTAAPRKTDAAIAAGDRQAFFARLAARHRCQPRAGGGCRRIRSRDAGHACERARRPASHVTFRAIDGRLHAVDGRLHADGVPHPEPDAGRPRLLRRHPRGAGRQGLEAALAAVTLEDVRTADVDAYFAPLPDGDLAL